MPVFLCLEGLEAESNLHRFDGLAMRVRTHAVRPAGVNKRPSVCESIRPGAPKKTKTGLMPVFLCLESSEAELNLQRFDGLAMRVRTHAVRGRPIGFFALAWSGWIHAMRRVRSTCDHSRRVTFFSRSPVAGRLNAGLMVALALFASEGICSFAIDQHRTGNLVGKLFQHISTYPILPSCRLRKTGLRCSPFR